MRNRAGCNLCVSKSSCSLKELILLRLVVVRRKPLRTALRRPAGARGRYAYQRAELVEGEGPVRVLGQGVLDAGQLGLPLGVRGLLPGLGPLEGDLVVGQQPAGPL